MFRETFPEVLKERSNAMSRDIQVHTPALTGKLLGLYERARSTETCKASTSRRGEIRIHLTLMPTEEHGLLIEYWELERVKGNLTQEDLETFLGSLALGGMKPRISGALGLATVVVIRAGYLPLVDGGPAVEQAEPVAQNRRLGVTRRGTGDLARVSS
ncbi:MAG: hypothetical protein VKP72_10700 [bacterium]|nr:hypothetical protein [bacterium]